MNAGPRARPRPIYVNGRFLSQRVTGVQRYAMELVRATDRLLDAGTAALAGRPVWLLVPPDACRVALEHVRCRTVGRLRGHAWEQLELPRAARDGTLVSPCNVGPITHRDQVLVVHDASVLAWPQDFTPAFRIGYRLLWRALRSRVARHVTVSEFSRRELDAHRIASAPRIAIAAGGSDHLDAVEADHAVLGALGLTAHHYVLAVGSPTRRKNLALLAEAAPRLPRGITAVVVGHAERHVFAASERPGGDRLVFAGAASDAALKALYTHALCLVHPSRYEGFGLPAVEAMRQGCPVIAARQPALLEVCAHAALYVDADDPPGLAAAITRLAADPAFAAALSREGRARAARFTWERTARALLSALPAGSGPLNTRHDRAG